MRPTVLLFDIDGTLISTDGAGRRAMARGFEAVHGRGDAIRFRMDGMTDRLIVRQGLEAIGAPVTKDAIDAVLDAYLAALAEELSNVPDERYRVHAGTREAIERSSERGAAIGLGTGNLRLGARLKLERVDLFRYFAFGGFGCDAEIRAELIRIGAERGAAQLGLPLGECRVVVIGDTPNDVDAARGIGAECVAVGTGAYSPQILLQSGATRAFSDLSAEGALEALLEGT